MKTSSILVFVGLWGSTALFSQESLLVEAAKRASTYWEARFGRCGAAAGGAVAFYSTISKGSEAGMIQMVPTLNVEFTTETISREEELNGIQFKATSAVTSGPFRWWIPQNKSWRDWQVGEIAPPVSIVRRNGNWTVQVVKGRYDDREAVTRCATIPSS
jgi:hypothetical protein